MGMASLKNRPRLLPRFSTLSWFKPPINLQGLFLRSLLDVTPIPVVGNMHFRV
jgi:hypothetical protein